MINFTHLPLGNYSLDFKGNNCFKPAELLFDVSGSEANITKDMNLEIVEEGYVNFKVSMDDFNTMTEGLVNDLEQAQNSNNMARVKELNEEIAQWNDYSKKIKRFEVNVTRYSENESE